MALSTIEPALDTADAAAVEELVRAHYPRIFRLALSILDDPAEADDAAQETFIAALERRGSFRGEAAFTTWLWAIAVNGCRQRLRRRRRQGRLLQAVQGLARLAGVSRRNVDQALVASELRMSVWGAINALAEPERLAVILRDYHELPIAEIARILGVSERTVYSRLQAGRSRLRAALQDERGGG